jgi:hypothetical protein
VSYFLFSPPGFLWEISKTHIALTTHSWFFPKKVFHVSYPRGNTNNMSSYFLLIFPLGFYRSFSDISLYIAPHIFPEKVFGGVIFMSYLQYFSPLGFLMGYQWHSGLLKSQINMLFSPYFPIRFKGVFMAYHIFLRFFP